MIELSSIYCVIKVHLQDWGNIFKKGHLVQFSIGNFGYLKQGIFVFLSTKAYFNFPSGASLTAFLRGHFISKFSRIACWSQRFQTILTTNVNWNSSTRDMIFMQTETQFSSHCSVSSLVIFLFQVSTVNLVGSPLLSYSL